MLVVVVVVVVVVGGGGGGGVLTRPHCSCLCRDVPKPDRDTDYAEPDVWK